PRVLPPCCLFAPTRPRTAAGLFAAGPIVWIGVRLDRRQLEQLTLPAGTGRAPASGICEPVFKFARDQRLVPRSPDAGDLPEVVRRNSARISRARIDGNRRHRVDSLS